MRAVRKAISLFFAQLTSFESRERLTTYNVGGMK